MNRSELPAEIRFSWKALAIQIGVALALVIVIDQPWRLIDGSRAPEWMFLVVVALVCGLTPLFRVRKVIVARWKDRPR